MLIGYTWAPIHHMLGGFRHFIWDTGHGFDLKTVDLLSWGLAGAVAAPATLLIWALVLTRTGGPLA